MAVMGIDRAKEATKRLGFQDCRSVLRLRRYQRTAKINGYVSLSPPGDDRVAKDRAEGAAEAVCRLIPPTHLNRAEDFQQFGCSKVRYGPVANEGVCEVEQPAHLLERLGRSPLDLEAGKPFIGDRLEGLFRFGFCLANLGLPHSRGILPVRQRFSRRRSLLASLGERHFGVATEGERLLFSEEAIVHPPEPATRLLNQKIQAQTIGQFVGLIL